MCACHEVTISDSCTVSNKMGTIKYLTNVWAENNLQSWRELDSYVRPTLVVASGPSVFCSKLFLYESAQSHFVEKEHTNRPKQSKRKKKSLKVRKYGYWEGRHFKLWSKLKTNQPSMKTTRDMGWGLSLPKATCWWGTGSTSSFLPRLSLICNSWLVNCSDTAQPTNRKQKLTGPCAATLRNSPSDICIKHKILYIRHFHIEHKY